MTWIKAAFLGAGCLLFVYLLLRLGPGEILSLVLQLKWAFAFISAAYLGHQLIRTAAFRECLAVRHSAGFGDLLRIRLAGEAVQFLTATGPFLAEPAKAWLLEKRGLSATEAYSATLAEYLFYTFVSSVMTIWGLTYLLLNFSLSRAAALASVIVAGSAALFLLVALFAIVNRIYLIGTIAKIVSRLPRVGNRLRLNEAAVRRTEDLLLAVLRSPPPRLARILALECFSQALLVAEVSIFLYALERHIEVVRPFLIESAVKVSGVAFFFIPGQLGAAEGTYSLAAAAIGLATPVGFGLALIRRLRSLLTAAAGFVFLSAGKRAASP